MSFLRKMFSGNVTTDDPRRYLIEAMLGAMEADGDVAAEEMDALQQNFEDYDIFEGLNREELARFIDLAADAIRDAGGGKKRVAAIGKALASRTHRLTAYAMACQVCAADAAIAESEIEYLDALQAALGLDDTEAQGLFEAVRRAAGVMTLEEKANKMREMMPHFVDCMALMAMADGEIHDEERAGIHAVLRSIPDMAVLTDDELSEAAEISLGRVAGKDINAEIAKMREIFDNPADRYWTTVYMMIVALSDGKTDWREIAFLKTVKSEFELGDEQMDHAMSTAQLFPAVELGGAPG